jgi:hypothetical protein
LNFKDPIETLLNSLLNCIAGAKGATGGTLRVWNRTHDLAFEASADSPDAGVVWSSTASHLAAEQRYEYVVEATLGDTVVSTLTQIGHGLEQSQ